MRKRLIAGNWKMYKKSSELAAFAEAFSKESGFVPGGRVEVAIAPSAPMLERAMSHFPKVGITVSAQTCHEEREGAFTGEISVGMLKDLDIATAIVGHSERRQYYNETDASVAAKAVTCLESGIRPIICVGETLAEREAGQTEAVLRRQIAAVLAKAPHLGSSVIAYEPVWAIGTGKTATDDEAEKAHAFIRSCVREKQPQVAEDLLILYGGSVKPNNIEGLLKQKNIDGALIGGASLKPEDFGKIVKISISA